MYAIQIELLEAKTCVYILRSNIIEFYNQFYSIEKAI